MTTIIKSKIVFAKSMNVLGINSAFFSLTKVMLKNNFIRAINYHDTPAKYASNFEKQLKFYGRNYSAVSYADLELFFETKQWKKSKPGLIISFDDGFRSNYATAAPLLEKYGFVGWFFIPVSFIGTSEKKQKEFATEHRIEFSSGSEERIVMSWDELRQLDKKHVIGCHTATHCRLSKSHTYREFEDEIVRSKHILESQLDHEVDIFCWVGGETWSYSRIAAKFIKKAGYRYAFQTNCFPVTTKTSRFHLQRTNIEANWPLELVKMQLSGFWDILYWPKRRIVVKRTTV